MKHKKTLSEKYPPSEPCSCEICLAYCKRPGWWTVREAKAAMQAGYGKRMMLEMAPDRSFGVLSPAFAGCEMDFAKEPQSRNGCGFLHDSKCELHGTGFQPLECRFCHHGRVGLGPKCHADIEMDWNSKSGRDLVVQWSRETGFWEKKNIQRIM